MRRLAVAALATLAASCGGDSAPAPRPAAPPPAFPPGTTPTVAAAPGDRFEDVTERAGIRFVHRVPDGHMDNLIEAIGAGATWFDADGDGKLDLFLAQSAWTQGVHSGTRPADPPTSRLYRNRGDGAFDDISERSGLKVADACFMALAADFDGDGAQDLYLLNDGRNRLFRNRGGGTFEDVTDRAGVGCALCSAGGAVLDADGDGHLDLYVGNYVTFDASYRKYYAPDAFPGPLAFQAQADVLYLNRGDGTFADATAGSGIDVPPGRAMGVTAWDYDLDGRTDVYVSNDASAAFLFHNETTQAGSPRFVEVAAKASVAYGFNGEAAAAMAGAVGDYDGDGLPDLHVTNAAYGSLFRNTGRGVFQDRVTASGLAAACGQYVSWGGGFGDFDDDGALDLFVANGDLHHPTGRPTLLLRGRGDGTFDDGSAAGGAFFRAEILGRGAAFADYDDDGRVDVLVTAIGDRPFLLRNRGIASNHHLTVDVRGARGNPTGLGAIVTVTAGGRKQVQVAQGSSGYLTQGDPRLHFGLGTASRADRVEVRWPGGLVQTLEATAADQILRVTQPEAPR